jgi:four helix bundle protein
MFDFQKLHVYSKSKEIVLDIRQLLESNKFDRNINDQLRRASLSIMLNIAEGTSRITNNDKRNFLVIARGSVFECVSILELLVAVEQISNEIYLQLYQKLEEISKMLFAYIQKLGGFQAKV